MNTEHLIYIIFYKLSYVYFTIKLPSFPTNWLTKFLTDANGLIKTKHLGFGILISFFFIFNNYKATPVPIDRPTTIIWLSLNPNFVTTNLNTALAF